MVNDPVADFINRLKTAAAAGREEIAVPYSKLKHAIADKLVSEGYIEKTEKQGRKERKVLSVTLKYTKGKSAISDVKRISKPSRRIYKPASDIYAPKSGRAQLILSTPQGILSDVEARKANTGGEALFMIW